MRRVLWWTTLIVTMPVMLVYSAIAGAIAYVHIYFSELGRQWRL